MNGYWKRHDKAKVIIERGWEREGGSEEFGCVTIKFTSIILIIPPHWQSISYSPPFKLCWPRLTPPPLRSQ